MKNLYILLILTFLLPTAFAVQEEVFVWELEEGTGGIALDSSSNGQLGILAGGTNFESDGSVPFGTYEVDFDGSNDYIVTTLTGGIPDNFTISLWSKHDNTDDDAMFHIFDSSGNLSLEFQFDVNGGGRDWAYNNNADSITTLDLDTGGTTTGVYYHNLITVNMASGNVTYYRDSIQAASILMTDVNYGEDSYTIRFGVDSATGMDFDGDMDAIKMYSGILNQSQINDLYNNNAVTLQVPEEEGGEDNVTTTIQADIINSYSPAEGSSFTSPVEFSITLNSQATCDLYIDNNFVIEVEDTLGFTANEFLNIGPHSYFFYCEQIVNDTLKFELTNVTNFNVNAFPPNVVTFQFTGTDFSVSDVDFTLVHPCMLPGLDAGAINADLMPYRSVYNPGGIKFAPVDKNTGIVTMNVTPGEQEFCLFHGRVTYDSLDTTSNYDIVEAYQQIELGDVFVPSNITAYYTVSLEQFDIYEITSPKAYGLTWSAFVMGLLLFVLGSLITFAGVRTNNGKVVFAGVILILSAFGISVTGLFALIV